MDMGVEYKPVKKFAALFLDFLRIYPLNVLILDKSLRVVL